MTAKWKRILLYLGLFFLGVMLVGAWAFNHWMGFMLRSPMATVEQYDWPMKVVAGDGQSGFKDGASPRFHKPIRFAPFGTDSVLVADIYNHALRVVHLDGTTTTLAGGPEQQGHKDGPVETAKFDSPHGVAVRKDGVIAVAEAANHTVRLLTPTRNENGDITTYEVSTIAGVPGEKGFKDGTDKAALFNAPHAVVWGADDQLYVADIGNSRLRQIKDGVVATLAGTGSFGSRDGDIKNGTMQYPMDMCLDSDGHLLIADGGTGLIRRFSNDRGLETPWRNVVIDMPHGIALDPNGDPIIAEMYGHRIVKITSKQELIRISGTDEAGAGPKELDKPAAVLVHAGHLWIADLNNHRVMTIKWPAE